MTGIDSFDAYYPREQKERNLRGARSSDRFTLVEADIRDAEAIDRVFAQSDIDGVLHMAALAGVRPSLERPAVYADVNVAGTSVVLAAAAAHGAPRVAFASSSSVYGEREEGPFRESDPVERPISPYAATKRACELVAHTFHYGFGLPVICARIFTAFGPRQRPDLAIRKFADRMLAGESIPVFGDGSALRDFTFVDDLVAGLIAAIDSDLDFEILNFGAGRHVSVSQVIAALENALGVRANIDRQPRQVGDVSKTHADISAAHSALGYAPKTSFDDGIAKFVEWLAAEGSE